MSLAPWREGQETDESVQTRLYGVCVLTSSYGEHLLTDDQKNISRASCMALL